MQVKQNIKKRKSTKRVTIKMYCAPLSMTGSSGGISWPSIKNIVILSLKESHNRYYNICDTDMWQQPQSETELGFVNQPKRIFKWVHPVLFLLKPVTIMSTFGCNTCAGLTFSGRIL